MTGPETGPASIALAREFAAEHGLANVKVVPGTRGALVLRACSSSPGAASPWRAGLTSLSPRPQPGGAPPSAGLARAG